jgi:hypothetical protein
VPVFVPKSGEVFRGDERLPAPDPWIRHLAYLMDGAIPIGRWSIGLDPLIGMIPGIGDLIGALISMVIVARAVQAGIPRVAVARMLANIAVDTLVGTIPLFGDAFDFAFKSNLKNLKIYEESLLDRRASAVRHWWFFGMLFLVIAAGFAAIAAGLFALARHLF